VVKLVPERFGFISPISGDKDVYVHSSVAGFQYLSAEGGVGYRAAPNAKKPGTLQAVALRRPAVAEGVPPS
jgi:cold shock CspA family protein